MSKKDTKSSRPPKKKTGVNLRVGAWRNRIIGESFDKLNYLCEHYRRKPSELVAILVDEEYKKIKGPKTPGL